jgi:hypothetical protein
MSGIIHSGSRRIVTAEMRPMTLFAFENSENRKFRNKKPEIFRMIL